MTKLNPAAMDIFKELGKHFEFKGENTYVEIPKDTIAQWLKDAQQQSMNAYSRVESRYVEMYLALKTENWKQRERDKIAQQEIVEAYDEVVDTLKQRVANLKEMIENLKKQIK